METIYPYVRAASPVEVVVANDGQNLTVTATNKGSHTVLIQSVVLLRRFENGAEGFAFIGEGFDGALNPESRVIHKNQNKVLASLPAQPTVLSAQALATFVEVTGLAVSDDTEFRPGNSTPGE